MGRFTNSNYTQVVNSLTSAIESKINNPYYKFSDKKPTTVIYYRINKEKSTLDPDSGTAYPGNFPPRETAAAKFRSSISHLRSTDTAPRSPSSPGNKAPRRMLSQMPSGFHSLSQTSSYSVSSFPNILAEWP